jgi:flagellar basal body-associated protein FliL
MSETPAPAKAESAPPPRSGGGSKLLFVVLLLALMNAGGTGFVALKMKSAPMRCEAAAPAPQEEKKEGSIGPTLALDSFVVNLNEPDAPRYLKTTLEFELQNTGAVEEMNHAKPAIRDEVLRQLSSLTVKDTLGVEGKEKIQVALTQKVDKLLGGNRVRRLFFNEFVVQ